MELLGVGGELLGVELLGVELLGVELLGVELLISGSVIGAGIYVEALNGRSRLGSRAR